MDFSIIDLSSFLGLCALVILSFNFLLGILLGTAYKKSTRWKRLPAKIRAMSIIKLHNATAYVALAIILLHPILLLFSKATKFKWINILLPFGGPHQPFWVALGVISLYAFTLVLITSQKTIRKRLGFRVWKNIHLVSYLTTVLVCLHGIFVDPALKDRQPDFLDGEKLICEFCLFIILAASIIRGLLYKNRKNLSMRHVNSLNKVGR